MDLRNSRWHLMAVVLLLAAAIASGCAVSVKDSRKRVTHVVVCWLKTPGDEAARRTLIERSKTFTSIPGVYSVRVGEALPSTRPAVDASFDVALAIEFDDADALHAYDQHPLHVKAVKEALQPLAAKVVIYDFDNR